MRVFNINEPECEYDPSDPEPYRSGGERFGPRIGASQMGATLYELPPGVSICPYHYEYSEEEWLLVVDGRATVRDPDGEHELVPGDVVCFPIGPDGAHKVTNRSETVVRVLMLSTVRPPSVCVYPDSDKVGVFPGNETDRLVVRRSDGRDYYDGEV